MILLLIGLFVSVILTLILNLISYSSVLIIILELLGFFIGTILLIIIFFIIISSFENKNKDIIKPKKIFSVCTYLLFDFLCLFFRVKVNIQGLEKVDFSNRYLIVSNHQSNIDPFIYIKIFRKFGVSFIIKKELTKFFVFRNWAHAAGFYELDRNNNRNAIKTIKKAIEAVQIRSIAVFPEGTRSKDGSLLDFKDGAFKIAQKGNVDVLVCMIDDVYNIKKRFPFKSTIVTLKICGVISREEVSLNSTIETSAKAYDMINKALSDKRK